MARCTKKSYQPLELGSGFLPGAELRLKRGFLRGGCHRNWRKAASIWRVLAQDPKCPVVPGKALQSEELSSPKVPVGPQVGGCSPASPKRPAWAVLLSKKYLKDNQKKEEEMPCTETSACPPPLSGTRLEKNLGEAHQEEGD